MKGNHYLLREPQFTDEKTDTIILNLLLQKSRTLSHPLYITHTIFISKQYVEWEKHC